MGAGIPNAFISPMVFCFEQNGGHLLQNHWKSKQNGGHFEACISKGSVFDHSYSYCYKQPFQNQTIGNPNFKMFSVQLFSIPLLSIQGFRMIRTIAIVNLNFKMFGMSMCLVFKPPRYFTIIHRWNRDN